MKKYNDNLLKEIAEFTLLTKNYSRLNWFT